jgi:rhamnopyranosyl-N-acetylglucosaminyl-diphospho-decaprenol beta-1,3/1,4-galactofuranosyltransferase
MSVAAVVVSYNRLDYLKKCLTALEHQTRPLDEIIVIENGSNDGSAEYIRDSHPAVTLFETGTNLGGAGGFAWGVEIAMAHGHDAAWLMDDDAEPELDALEPLVEKFESMTPRPSFLASLVTAGRGTFNTRNPPVVSKDAQKQVRASELGGIAIDAATFVGVLINLKVAATTHLPFKDFFIWIDDSEYTHRLSKMGFAMTVKESQVNHPVAKGIGEDMGSRLFFHVRNSLWYIRERGFPLGTNVFDVLLLIQHSLQQLLVSRSKKDWLIAVAKGYGQGLFTKPTRHMPGDLLATLSTGGRKAINC